MSEFHIRLRRVNDQLFKQSWYFATNSRKHNMNPEGPLQEKDWKYMRSIHDELLHVLCTRINDGAVQRATSGSGNPHERYLELYTFIRESDKIVAECFNDWRRSTLLLKISALRSHGLLSDAHVEHFSDSARAWLARVEAFEWS